ncbi:RagB/SusD family nutrient uptake outer membrane protein [Chryseobacterium herbae]|uniref:RagB/SusD family nutrient uptake outer membrane protein n=1 Tax=Chryseobacterium herbae TaxID=2976476 RepID=A0ABT2IU21_9FLAO|nr:RagB/SusD family nutrient uptake outer membrane protein [Chryseobacterium sp. pc1-10]MCT2561835.1 RagB/SusD family nutrient uptake outer membrane protein [Chryseobacterium sp. pc1-10]
MRSLYFLVLFAFFCSCKKFVEIDAPITKISAFTVFQDDATATSAILGMYARLVVSSPAFSNGAATIYLSTASDELVYSGTNADMSGFYTNTLNSGNSIVYRDFWRYPYETIYQANACIEGLEKSTGVTPSLKMQLLGEAYFIRAFCYYYLVNLFGDVPLIKTTDFEINAKALRSRSLEITNSMIDDLQQARDRLSKSYPSAGRLRVNFYTATVLLNRIYLQQQNWELVEKTANEILSSNQYSLETDLSKTFLMTSTEAFWELAFPDASTFNTIEGSRFIPLATANVVPAFNLTSSLFNSFESGDLRKTHWIGSKSVSGTTYYYPYKYKVRGAAVKTEHCIVFRLPEIYFNRAEARVYLNNLSGALSDLNTIRQRANPSWTSFSSSEPVVIQAAIQKERRIEYFAEWGHRWFDLKRTGHLNDILMPLKTTWKATANVFPIPSAEILTNQNLTQNPGY